MILGTDWSYNKRLQRSFRDDMGTLGQTLGGVRSLGSASLGLAWVAAGRYDAYFNYNLRPWDIAAAWLLIEEAGGTVSNRLGELGEWDVNGMDVFGSNGRIHSPFLDLLQQGWPANQQS